MYQVIMFYDLLSKNFEIYYDGVKKLDKSNITHFSKKNPFLGKCNWDLILVKIMQPYLLWLTLSEDLFEVLWYDEAQ